MVPPAVSVSRWSSYSSVLASLFLSLDIINIVGVFVSVLNLQAAITQHRVLKL